jgi:hypothetical protein
MIEELPEFERKLQVRVIKTAADPIMSQLP